jgi:hypothetical protein
MIYHPVNKKILTGPSLPDQPYHLTLWGIKILCGQ